MKTKKKFVNLMPQLHSLEGRPQGSPLHQSIKFILMQYCNKKRIQRRNDVGATLAVALQENVILKPARFFAIVIFLFVAFSTHAQSLTKAATMKSTTSSDTVNITEPFEAIVELNLSAGTRFDSSYEVCAFDTTFDVATSYWETKDGFKWQNKLLITAWDTGKIKIVTSAKIKSDTDTNFKIITNSFFVTARYPTEIDSMKQILPIKDIIKEPTYITDYILQYALPFILTISIVGLFWYLFKRYKKSRENKKNYKGPYLSPYMKAIKNIEALKIPLLMPEVDDFFNKVSKEVRLALYDAENIFTLHKTTTETVVQLQLKKFTSSQIETLKQILSSADMVKFAQMQPPQTICSDFKNTVLALLRELENNKK